MTDGKRGLIVVRSSHRLDTIEVDGLATTTLPRTLVDIAAADGPAVARRAWKEADYLGLLDVDEIERSLASNVRKGNAVVLGLLAEMPRPRPRRVRLRSRSELACLHLIEAAGLPLPETDVPRRLEGVQYFFDFFWRDLGLVLELDDASHRRPSAIASDAIRDQRCRAAGLEVLRITTARLRRDPDGCMTELALAIARRRAAGSAA